MLYTINIIIACNADTLYTQPNRSIFLLMWYECQKHSPNAAGIYAKPFFHGRKQVCCPTVIIVCKVGVEGHAYIPMEVGNNSILQ